MVMFVFALRGMARADVMPPVMREDVDTYQDAVAERIASERAEWVENLISLNGPWVGRPSIGLQLTETEMVSLIAAHFAPEWQRWALTVSRCESGWLSNAKNPGSTAAGIWQFIRTTWDWVSTETGSPTYDAGGVWEVNWQMVNTSWLVENGGPQHWVCKG
jgi:hypothetical protein